MIRPRKNKNIIMLGIEIERELHKQLKVHAAHKGVSMRSCVQWLIENALAMEYRKTLKD